MQSSAEEAIVFFEKWAQNNVLVRVLILAGGVRILGDAKIGFSEGGLSLLCVSPSDERLFTFEVAFAEIKTYEYGTPRDVSAELLLKGADLLIGDCWFLDTKSGARIAMFGQEISN